VCYQSLCGAKRNIIGQRDGGKYQVDVESVCDCLLSVERVRERERERERERQKLREERVCSCM
jgi:hypothetical protein